MVLALAVDALGAENVTGVRLPSRYTSDLSNDLAEQQALASGVRLLTIPIEAPFRGFSEALASAFEGRAADTTEENLQSRCRGAILMALANKFGGLLLTTGNKSEYAVGYATIYGDMCGGYAPIKDLYKTEVFSLARWRNEQGIGNGESGIGKPASQTIPAEVISRPLRRNCAKTRPTRTPCRPTQCWMRSCCATSTMSSRARKSWLRVSTPQPWIAFCT